MESSMGIDLTLSMFIRRSSEALLQSSLSESMASRSGPGIMKCLVSLWWASGGAAAHCCKTISFIPGSSSRQNSHGTFLK